jgi:hypothetical protein
MQYYIGIGMAHESARVRDGNAAKYERATFRQAMSIVPAANSEGHLCHSVQIRNLRGL